LNVQWPDVFPAWQGTKSLALILLCMAMLCFPFSVAATNVALGLMLATGVLTGLWWQGVAALWHGYRVLSLAIAAYLGLVIIGLLWSLDPAWGMKILGRHWFWMILPVIVMLLSDVKNRSILLFFVSLGLSLNLIYCVLQIFDVVSITLVGGSSSSNPTGHIGHTSFGFIYGIWAAWLLHTGLLCRNKLSWLLWGLASWAVVMVFLAQGKSGYIVTLVVVLFVAIRWLHETGGRRMFVILASVLLLLFMALALGPGKERVVGTWQALTGTVQKQLNTDEIVAVSSATARMEWWKMSYHIWLEQPLMGVGTGGFPKAVVDWQATHIDEGEFAVALVHPHNQYLLVMVRWGVIGLVLLLALLYFWIRAGAARSWQHSVAMPLVTLTGVALLVHGLSSSSLEEHFSTIFALVLAGTGLSENIFSDDAA